MPRTFYEIGQKVVERIGDDESAKSRIVTIASRCRGIVTTSTGNEYDAFTGGRLHRDDPYRSIRRLTENDEMCLRAKRMSRSAEHTKDILEDWR